MLGKDRVKEAQSNVKDYLDQGLLRKVKISDKKILSVYVKNSKDSLNVAGVLFKNDYSDLWTIVCGYYAMYYIANAVLYKLGYKVGHKISHKITADALIVFVRNKLKDSLIEDYEELQQEALEIAGLRADELIESFDVERRKRSRLQYEMTESVKRAKAKTSLERAKRFVFEMEKVLE